MQQTEIILNEDGSLYHLGAKKGQINNRMIIVGSHERANVLKELLDKHPAILSKLSSRLYLIHSGYYHGVPVSIVGIGMGVPMVDFFVRETMYLIGAPLAIIRFGTCGLLNEKFDPGMVVVAGKGSCYCYTNYAAFDGLASSEEEDKIKESIESPSSVRTLNFLEKKYIITKPVLPDLKLSSLLLNEINYHPDVEAVEGLNASGEMFYSTQGRRFNDFFEDENAYLFDEFNKLKIDSFEMETHQLFHLAKRAKIPIFTAACAVGVVNRSNKTAKKLSTERQNLIYRKVGLACLESLIKFDMQNSK